MRQKSKIDNNATMKNSRKQMRRKEQYEQAVERIEKFENQYSPKLTDYNDDLVKKTMWDDKDGKRHYEFEDITPGEKEQLDEAWDIIHDYEENYRDEWQSLRINTDVGTMQPANTIDELPKAKNNTALSNDQIQSLRDMSVIRAAHHEPEKNRLAEFAKVEQVVNGRDDLNAPFIEKGKLFINEFEITTKQEFIDAMVDAHGNDYKLYGFEVRENDGSEKTDDSIIAKDGHDEVER